MHLSCCVSRCPVVCGSCLVFSCILWPGSSWEGLASCLTECPSVWVSFAVSLLISLEVWDGRFLGSPSLQVCHCSDSHMIPDGSAWSLGAAALLSARVFYPKVTLSSSPTLVSKSESLSQLPGGVGIKLHLLEGGRIYRQYLKFFCIRRFVSSSHLLIHPVIHLYTSVEDFAVLVQRLNKVNSEVKWVMTFW